MKRIIPLFVLIMLVCVGCRGNHTNDKVEKTDKQTLSEEETTQDNQEEQVHLDLKENEWYLIGQDDLDYGYRKIAFFDSDMKVKKYFDNAVLPGRSMGSIDITKPVILGILDDTKRNGATVIEANQYTYGVFDLMHDKWVIPIQYDSMTQFANGCYGASLYNDELETTSMALYNEEGNLVAEGIDVTNSYVSCLGDYLWNISYDGEQPIEIYDKMGTCVNKLDRSYGMVHGQYFVASNAGAGDVIYDSKGDLVITKDTVVKSCKLNDVEAEHFFVVDYNDYSHLIEAQLGKYQLILDKKGNLISCIDQELEPDKVVSVEYWVYCISKTLENKVEDETEPVFNDSQDNNIDSDEEDIWNDDAEVGIVTNKEDTIYDVTNRNREVAYYDREGNHLLTTEGQEFQGHLQPYGVDFTPHDLFYQKMNGFEVYDYECKETFQFNIGEMGIVELQSPLHNYYIIMNELDEETKISVYYKNLLIAEGQNLVVQVLGGNLVITDYSEDYAFDEVSHIYDEKGAKIYDSPCYETIEVIGDKYLITQRDGVRNIVDYLGNVVYAFDHDIEVEE